MSREMIVGRDMLVGAAHHHDYDELMEMGAEHAGKPAPPHHEAPPPPHLLHMHPQPPHPHAPAPPHMLAMHPASRHAGLLLDVGARQRLVRRLVLLGVDEELVLLRMLAHGRPLGRALAASIIAHAPSAPAGAARPEAGPHVGRDLRGATACRLGAFVAGSAKRAPLARRWQRRASSRSPRADASRVLRKDGRTRMLGLTRRWQIDEEPRQAALLTWQSARPFRFVRHGLRHGALRRRRAARAWLALAEVHRGA